MPPRVRPADFIRYVTVRQFVVPVLGDGDARFTIEQAHAHLRKYQQQHVRASLTAQGPLAAYGITWVVSDGPATRHQEIHWTWQENNEILLGVADQGWTVDMVLQRTVPWWRRW